MHELITVSYPVIAKLQIRPYSTLVAILKGKVVKF